MPSITWRSRPNTDLFGKTSLQYWFRGISWSFWSFEEFTMKKNRVSCQLVPFFLRSTDQALGGLCLGFWQGRPNRSGDGNATGHQGFWVLNRPGGWEIFHIKHGLCMIMSDINFNEANRLEMSDMINFNEVKQFFQRYNTKLPWINRWSGESTIAIYMDLKRFWAVKIEAFGGSGAQAAEVGLLLLVACSDWLQQHR